MKTKFTIRDSSLYNKVWKSPVGKVKERICKACDDLPHKKRLTVVTVMLSAFVLIAFFVFGHACYKIGQGQARKSIDVEHIRPIELEDSYPDKSNHIISAYDTPGSESEAQ